MGTLVRDLLKEARSEFLESNEGEDSAIDYLLEEADHIVDVDGASEMEQQVEGDLISILAPSPVCFTWSARPALMDTSDGGESTWWIDLHLDVPRAWQERAQGSFATAACS